MKKARTKIAGHRRKSHIFWKLISRQMDGTTSDMKEKLKKSEKGNPPPPTFQDIGGKSHIFLELNFEQMEGTTSDMTIKQKGKSICRT
jgi:hypothetical protein